MERLQDAHEVIELRHEIFRLSSLSQAWIKRLSSEELFHGLWGASVMLKRHVNKAENRNIFIDNKRKRSRM